MKRHRPNGTEVDTHVFDQTNGVLDPGTGESRPDERGAKTMRNRAVAGAAMLSTQRP